MHTTRGQGTIEYAALLGAVALLMVGAAALRHDPDLPQRIASRIAATFGASSPRGPSAEARAALDAALGADLSGRAPALRDAALRIAEEIGPEAARALVLDEALRRHLPPVRAVRWEPLADPSLADDRPDLDGIGPMIDPGVWSTEGERGAPTVHLVDQIDEETWRASLIPSRTRRAIEGAPRAAIAIARLIQPGISTAVMVSDATTAALGPAPPRGIPPGSREDDLILCRPVWRTNHATPAWRTANPFLADRLQVGRRRPALDVRVVRHGRTIARTVLWHDGTGC